ncbi:MAG: hypothetical protein EZS28_019751 [Streblomastix strix]|uniref:Uncharacterized protein n=1 Tax=Streblomastix strix TaxID=222440 RepID=A0A5J4VQ47_9EUKA|nr:MAG: hypothetical protein EZS28_019751 [Streblomastix strix]
MIQTDEADFEEIAECALQHRLAAEQRYYEQRAADRKTAKEQAENQNFELDRRCNLPTLYDKNSRRLRTKKKKLIVGNYVYV